MVRWVDLPAGVVKKLKLPPAQNRGWQAILRFNRDIDRVTLLPGKPGKIKLAFKVELLRAAHAEAGDFVEFTLEADTASREPELPEEMRKAFQTRPELAAAWERQSIAFRRQLVRYVYQAKNPGVQAKRCWLFIERLAETGSLKNPDYS